MGLDVTMNFPKKLSPYLKHRSTNHIYSASRFFNYMQQAKT